MERGLRLVPRAPDSQCQGCHSPPAVFLFTREHPVISPRPARRPPAPAQPSAAMTVSSIDANFTKPAYKRSSCASDMASRSTPGVASGGRALEPTKRILAARGSETAHTGSARSPRQKGARSLDACGLMARPSSAVGRQDSGRVRGIAVVTHILAPRSCSRHRRRALTHRRPAGNESPRSVVETLMGCVARGERR